MTHNLNGKSLLWGSQHFSSGRKGLKAQSEYVIIFSMVIISAVVVFVVSQTVFRPEPANVAELKNLLKADIERVIQASATDVIASISKQGGYLSTPPDNIEFAGNKVPYWGVCENKFIPTLDQVANNIKTGLEKKLNGFDFSDIKRKHGKEIAIENANKDNMDVLIREQDVVLDVYLPTSLEGFGIQQPYKIAVPLPLGRAYGFASNFIDDNSKTRHFERFIASLFYHAKEEKLPTLDLLSNCGDFIFKTFDDLKSVAQKIVDYSLSNIYFWSPAPPDNQRKFLEYYIPEIGGQKYPDLDIKFYRGADLSQKNFQASKSPVSVVNAKPVNRFVPKCFKDVDVEYTLNLPVITSVKSGSYEFNFAHWAFVDNNKIGRCQAKIDFSAVEDPCEDRQCSSKITVVDSKGKPIPDTKVSFGSCTLGVTDQNGIASGKAPCGVSELVVYNPGYTYFYDVVSSLDLDKKVTLKKPPLILFNFNRASVNIEEKCSYARIVNGTIQDEWTIKCQSLPPFSWTLMEKNRTYSIDVQPEEAYDIFVYFKPKKQRPWNPAELMIGNVFDSDNLGEISSDLSAVSSQGIENYTIETNLTITYSDGTRQSNLIEFPLSINISSENLVTVNLTVNNTNNNLQQNIISVNPLLDGVYHNLISGSDSTTAENAGFSQSSIKIDNNTVLSLLWSNTTSEGFIKPGEQRNFSAKINITSEIFEEADQSTAEEKKTKDRTSKLVDFLPADNYTVEVRINKPVTYKKRFCSKPRWYGCGGHKTIEAGMIISGISNLDLEVVEEEKELYINAFVPSFTVTGNEETDYYYNGLLSNFTQNCNFGSINRTKPNPTSCRFVDIVVPRPIGGVVI